MKPLHPSIRTVWRVKLAIVWGLITLGLGVYEILQFFSDAPGSIPTGTRTMAALIVAVTIVVIIPSLRYRFWRYELREDELYLQRGILNRVNTIVPLRRIQHLDVSQDVLEREFELGKLIVHTAGSRSSDVVVPGLHISEAEHLRDTLKFYILEDTL